MTHSLWQLPNSRRQTILFLFCFSVVVVLAHYVLQVRADADLWGHTLFGLTHLQSGQLLRVDPYSFTANGNLWINHEWLSELIFGFLYQQFGQYGLFGLRGVMLILTALLMLRLFWLKCKNPLFTIVFFVPAMMYLATISNIRPQLFTNLMVLIFFMILESNLQRSTGKIFIFPLLMVLWVNLHGGFALGVVISGVGLGYTFVSRRLKKQTALRSDCLIPLCFALIVAATLINPYGIELLRFIQEALLLHRPQIIEWNSLSGEQLYIYWAISALTTLAILYVKSWKRSLAPVLFMVLSVGSYHNMRFFPLYFIFATICLLEAIDYVWSHKVETSLLSKNSPVGSLVIYVLIACVLLLQVCPQTLRYLTKNGLRVRVDSTFFPVRAVAFLKQNALGPHLATRFNWGEYAIWHLYPNYLVSVDGRYETVYDTDWVEQSIDAEWTGEIKDFLHRESVDVILVKSNGPLAKNLNLDEKWSRVYDDNLSAVYIPSGKKETIKPLEEDFAVSPFFP